MLTLIILYLLITLTCVASGFLVEGWLSKKHETHVHNRNWVVYACWGLIMITCVGQVAALFLPLNQWSWLAFSLVVLSIYILNKQCRQRLYGLMKQITSVTLPLALTIIAAMLLVAMFSAGPTLMDDTESYHIQMVKWIQEYGSPPGLANLHERYGFNSSWFTVVAFFVPARTTINFYTAVNGTLSLWLIIYLSGNAWSMKPAIAGRHFIAVSSLLVLLAGFFCWPMMRGNATNTNYDFVTALLLLVLFIELLKKDKDDWQKFLPELIIWPVYLFTVRIINYPYLLVSVFGLVQCFRYKHYTAISRYTLLSISLVIPFLARNVLLSGYLFYPFYQVDLFNVDWKADKVLAKEILTFIKYFNRVNAGFMPVEETAKLGTPAWIPVWFKHLFTYDKPVLIAGVAGLITMPLMRSKWKQLSPAVKCLIMVGLLQLVSWFIIAPDPRFVYGPLLTGIVLIPVILLKWKPAVSRGRHIRSGIIFTATLMFIYTVMKVARNENYFNPLLPVTLPSPATQVIKLHNLELRIPEKLPVNWNARCYATELPCLYEVQPGLKPRGAKVRDGFRIENDRY
jgi:hypothetical protein